MARKRSLPESIRRAMITSALEAALPTDPGFIRDMWCDDEADQEWRGKRVETETREVAQEFLSWLGGPWAKLRDDYRDWPGLREEETE